MSLLIAKDDVVPRDPVSLAGFATILAGSSALIRTLIGAGSYNQEKNQVLVADSRHNADIPFEGRSMSFRLREERNVPFEATRRLDGTDTDEAITWWLPLPFKVHVRIIAFVIVTGVIIALEIVLDQSHHYWLLHSFCLVLGSCSCHGCHLALCQFGRLFYKDFCALLEVDNWHNR